MRAAGVLAKGRMFDMPGVHDHSLYLACPDVLRTLGEASYGKRVAFIGSDIVFTVVLFIYLYLRCKGGLGWRSGALRY